MVRIKKTGTALAVTAAALLCAPCAGQAAAGPAIDLYGVANVSLDYVINNDPTPGFAGSGLALSSNQSRLGFYASEDIGNGWQAAGRVEGGVNVDTGQIFGGTAATLRDTYAALIGPYGELRAGHYSSVYKTATEPLDPFIDTLADAQAVLGNVDGSVLFSEWYNNVIGWRAPGFHGFEGGVDIIVNQGNDNLPLPSSSNTFANNAKATGFSLAVAWRGQGLHAGLAYELRNNFAYSKGISAFELYGGADLLRRAHVGAVFETASTVLGTSAANASTPSRSAFYLSGSYRVRAKDTVAAAFGALGSLGSVSGSGATWLAIGVNHALSPHAAVYAFYTIMMNGSHAAYGLGQFQGQVIPPSDGVVPGIASHDVSAFSVGIRLDFGNDDRAGT